MWQMIQLKSELATPVYRQLHYQIRSLIHGGRLHHGEKLPATRELAGQLRLNRTTVAAAYDLLEAEGLIRGHVGRGSFVQHKKRTADVTELGERTISFASSRPSEVDFPVAELQASCQEVLASPEAAAVLQLGSPAGYAPLRQHLMAEAIEEGVARPDEDDILITSGCQQALDLIARALMAETPGSTVAVEDPVYPGVKQALSRAQLRLAAVSCLPDGLDGVAVARVFAADRPKWLVTTPDFQNPTGITISAETRGQIISAAAQFGVSVVENEIYRPLRYLGSAVAPLRQLGLQQAGTPVSTLLVRSFSKMAFPGLRVGWIIGRRDLIARLTEARQWSDLHTDQLSQAVLLRFSESGRLKQHLSNIRRQSLRRLQACLEACERYLPPGSAWTRPEGGMSLWVTLPDGLTTSEILPKAHAAKLSFLAGEQFSVLGDHGSSLRLCFGGVPVEDIEEGVRRLGQIARAELLNRRSSEWLGTAPALV